MMDERTQLEKLREAFFGARRRTMSWDDNMQLEFLRAYQTVGKTATASQILVASQLRLSREQVASHLQKERVKIKKSKLDFHEYITQQIEEVEQRQARRKRTSLDSFLYLQNLHNNNNGDTNSRNSYGPVVSSNSFSGSQSSVVYAPSPSVSYQSSDEDKIRDIFENDFPSVDRVSFLPKEKDLEMHCLPQQPYVQPAQPQQPSYYYPPALPVSPVPHNCQPYEDYDYQYTQSSEAYYPPAPSTFQPQPHPQHQQSYDYSMPLSPEPHHFAPHHAYSSPYAYVDSAAYALN